MILLDTEIVCALSEVPSSSAVHDELASSAASIALSLLLDLIHIICLPTRACGLRGCGADFCM